MTKDYIDRVIRDLRRDIIARIDSVRQVAERYEDRQGELLTGFPATYATKGEVEQVRTTVSDLQLHLIGRERFETFEGQVGDQFKALAVARGRSQGVQTAMLAGAFIIVTVAIVLLTQMLQNVNELQDRTRVLEKQAIVMQGQIAAIRSLDRFFCQTRTAAKLPSC